jgi:hypothetical protein
VLDESLRPEVLASLMLVFLGILMVRPRRSSLGTDLVGIPPQTPVRDHEADSLVSPGSLDAKGRRPS